MLQKRKDLYTKCQQQLQIVLFLKADNKMSLDFQSVTKFLRCLNQFLNEAFISHAHFYSPSFLLETSFLNLYHVYFDFIDFVQSLCKGGKRKGKKRRINWLTKSLDGCHRWPGRCWLMLRRGVWNWS